MFVYADDVLQFVFFLSDVKGKIITMSFDGRSMSMVTQRQEESLRVDRPLNVPLKVKNHVI